MTPCPGLIPCTPTPPPAQLGLTVLERQQVSDVTSWALVFGFVVVISVVVLAYLWALVIATREP